MLLVALIALGIGLVYAFAAYWPYILGFLLVVFAIHQVVEAVTPPVSREVRAQIPIRFSIHDAGTEGYSRLRHRIDFTLKNNTPDMIVSDLHFSCEGGRTKSHPARIRPGQSLNDSLQVEWSEELSACVPVYDLEEVL